MLTNYLRNQRFHHTLCIGSSHDAAEYILYIRNSYGGIGRPVHGYQQLVELFRCDGVAQLAGGAESEGRSKVVACLCAFRANCVHRCGSQLTLAALLAELEAGSFRPSPRVFLIIF